MLLLSWQAIMRVHPVHLMKADSAPGGRQSQTQLIDCPYIFAHVHIHLFNRHFQAILWALVKVRGTRELSPISVLRPPPQRLAPPHHSLAPDFFVGCKL